MAKTATKTATKTAAKSRTAKPAAKAGEGTVAQPAAPAVDPEKLRKAELEAQFKDADAKGSAKGMTEQEYTDLQVRRGISGF